jgi:tRNA-splicing ligase RtcB
MMANYEYFQQGSGRPVKAWTHGVVFEEKAKDQVLNVASLPFIYKHVAVMPDVHYGLGATIGSVIPTEGAICPASVGVDIGCGLQAVQTSMTAKDLPDSLKKVRSLIEAAVPHGRTDNGRAKDVGGWKGNPSQAAWNSWMDLEETFSVICDKHPKIRSSNSLNHLGTLGTGNHFIEVCLDENDRVWFMLHSGSRGVGNRIGTYFIYKAKEEMKRWYINLPDANLAYLVEGSRYFGDYVEALTWAQRFARTNRDVMMAAVIKTLQGTTELPPFSIVGEVVDCHHNFSQKERHFGKVVWVTRKGAVRARQEDSIIIPGSMGNCSYIGRGLGNEDSFHSCSHGAGRVMSRGEAKKTFTLADHEKSTSGVECRKDEGILDETPGAYKPIDAVMAAQTDLVEVMHTLRQVVCVKG